MLLLVIDEILVSLCYVAESSLYPTFVFCLILKSRVVTCTAVSNRHLTSA